MARRRPVRTVPISAPVSSTASLTLDRVADAQAQSIDGRPGPQDELPHPLLGRREHARGEDRRIDGREVERRAAHAPALHQVLVLGDGFVQPALADIPQPGVQGQQRRPERAVLDAARSGDVEQIALDRLVVEMVALEAERDHVASRH